MIAAFNAAQSPINGILVTSSLESNIAAHAAAMVAIRDHVGLESSDDVFLKQIEHRADEHEARIFAFVPVSIDEMIAKLRFIRVLVVELLDFPHPARTWFGVLERDVLAWAASGKTAGESTDILGNSVETANSHTQNVHQTTASAVATSTPSLST